ncbi:cytosolic 5'-nucleotidase 1A-like [Platichthys flesus]|uniref:cytosolic 5'-nucleotidase 1A-like n=1 Tax=Platichthys flesus TaxID=8260 RepID=UPI002DBD7A0C|nr:cytosolic 5'-nucleotidase 1A-like [Platichthys flesus]
MSLNSQTLTGSGQDWTTNGSSSSSSRRGPMENERMILKPSTPTRNPIPPENAITIAVSAQVLFNMEKEQQIYEQQGMEGYIQYQREHETEPFSPGPACSFVKALEAVNTQLRKLYPDSEELFDVVLMTDNDAEVGPRLNNTINHHQLFIERFCETGGNRPVADHTHLYLSSDPGKVREALAKGIAAAIMFTPEKMNEVSETQLRVAFDGDGVLFSDESERIFKKDGLEGFQEHEKTHEKDPMKHGPMKCFLEALGKLQNKLNVNGQRMDCPIRTYLVTARDDGSAGKRAMNTLSSWGLEIDEAHFLAGAPKGPKLEEIRPHIFFDDQKSHVDGAVEMGTVACHVPYGKANELSKKGVMGKETSAE